MTTATNNPKIFLFRFIMFTVLLLWISKDINAQDVSIAALQQIITIMEDSLVELNNKTSSLSQSLNQLNETIFQQKQNLKGSSNLLKRYNLNRNLKKAQQVAVEMEAINIRIRTIRYQLQENYHFIINQYEAALKETMQSNEINTHNGPTTSILSLLDTLEKNKRIYQQKLTDQSFQKSEQPSLEIEDNDNLERLQLKNTLLQDRVIRFHREEQQLMNNLEDQQSNLSVYEDLIIFTDNLQQSIDPEQEYFDQERMDQLKDEVFTLKANISHILERLQQIKTSIKSLEDQQIIFQKTIQNKLKNSNSGGSTGYE